MKKRIRVKQLHIKKFLIPGIIFVTICLIGIFLYQYFFPHNNTISTNENPQGQWAFDKIQLQKAWTVTKGKGAKIAIIDSGFDVTNSLISEKIVGVDYYHSGEQSAEDTMGHGTKISTIISGHDGVCPECQLIVVKLGTIDSNVKIAQTIRWAVNQGANVINLSFVIDHYDDQIQQEIYRAWEKGVVLVAAAGNNHTTDLQYPAAYGPVIAVAATDQDDRKASFSNYGEWVNIAAPGVGILTHGVNGRIIRTSGTSIAAPIVAGIAGLVWASPYGTSNETVVKRLCETADPIKETGTSWKCGRVNAARAVGAIK